MKNGNIEFPLKWNELEKGKWYSCNEWKEHVKAECHSCGINQFYYNFKTDGEVIDFGTSSSSFHIYLSAKFREVESPITENNIQKEN
jgi:hypothetical protein